VGGFITPPKEYFGIVERIVRNHGGIFISDEVQTGWGRTGDKWFGIEQYGVTPDIITSAKGLANGSPIGLTVARPQVADSVRGLTISTFGGNPVTATAAKAVIDFIEEHQLAANCADTGAYLRAGLEDLQKKHETIGDVRGMGLLQAIELVEDRKTKSPASAQTALVMEAARESGLLVGKGGMWGNVLRLSPPMNIGRADVDEFLKLLDRSFAACSSVLAGASR
jgi:4-aminobutyrate aminotransferase-like enzyme